MKRLMQNTNQGQCDKLDTVIAEIQIARKQFKLKNLLIAELKAQGRK